MLSISTMHMSGRSLLAAGLLIVTTLFTGCADAEKTIASAEVTYTRMVRLADDYAQWPRCPQPAGVKCADQTDVNNMVAAAEEADKALDQAWAAFDRFEGDSDKIDAAVDAAMAAVDIFDSVVTRFFPTQQSEVPTVVGDTRWRLAMLPDGGRQLLLSNGERASILTWR